MKKQVRKLRRERAPHPFRLFLVLCVCITAVGALTASVPVLFSGNVEPGAETQLVGEKNPEAPRDPGIPETANSGFLLREQGIATADGVGRIPEDTAQGRLLGRRAALTDARRNLLLLRQKLLDGTFDGRSVSGKIAEVRIHSEKTDGALYYLKVDVPLSRLMKGDVPVEVE